MATTAHTEHPAGEKAAFPPFNAQTYASQLFWLALTFLFLYVVMSRIALPRIGGIIENRQKRIADDLAQAQNLKGEADAAMASYEKALADARTRAQAIATEMRETQTAQANASRTALETQLNARLAEAETSIAATKTAAMTNVNAIAEDAASAIVQRLIGVTPAPATVAAAVADARKR